MTGLSLNITHREAIMAKTLEETHEFHLAKYLDDVDRSKALGPTSVQRICGIGYNLARHVITYGIGKGVLIGDEAEHGFHRVALAYVAPTENATPARAEPIKLLPCTFCGGPPSPAVTRALHPYGSFTVDDIPPNGITAEGYVFCHECGADGPKLTDEVFDQAGIDRLRDSGVRLWQRRDNRNGDCYDGGEAEGLNLYPRESVVTGLTEKPEGPKNITFKGPGSRPEK